jgi:hypothetical protein
MSIFLVDFSTTPFAFAAFAFAAFAFAAFAFAFAIIGHFDPVFQILSIFGLIHRTRLRNRLARK